MSLATTTIDRTSFGSQLRAWRTRRRMSQLELATQAEVSSRHLSFLETGRSNPSREMVVHLSEALDVPLAQRNELLNAAGFAPAYSGLDLDDEAMGAVREAIDTVLAAHEPFPAVVVDGRWNLVSANAAAFAFMGDVAPHLLDGTVNVVRLSVHPDGLAPRIVNFGEYAAHMVFRLRRQLDRTGDEQLAELLDEVMGHVSGTNLSVAPTESSTVVLPMALRSGDRVLSWFSTIWVFGAPNDVTLDDLAIESFYPADEATRDAVFTAS